MRSMILLVTFLATLPLHAQPTQPADVPVKAVVLFSSGVGYFEHFGSVTGDSATELRFKTDQINDILKSLVLQDLDKGTVSTVTYPSQDPLERQLRSFQIDLSGNPPLAMLLNQLRGAKVTVQQIDQKVTGTILGVETKKRSVGEEKSEPVDVAVLNLVTDSGIRSIMLDEISGIELQDPQLQAELNKALAALAQARDEDKKPVQINFRGKGERRVRVGYVVETPIWKTSYRLILPEAADAKPSLQGWAIVENQTDNDWNDVQLSLVSGRPISFVMNLYQPLYIPRPVVELELYASLRPQTYEGAAYVADLEGVVTGHAAKGDRRRQAGALMDTMAAATPAPADQPASEAADFASSIRSIASAAQLGELFQYTVGNVSLPRQKSAMIPIITDEIEVEKLSIYNLAVLPRHPLNGARVKNTTGKHLLQGPITVLEQGAYAGDAKINDVPPGQERLISYGVDLQMLVDATKQRQESAILTGKIVKGVLHLQRKNLFTQEYAAENKSDRPKTLIVEHAFRGGWGLVDTPEPIEKTDQLYRFKLAIEPKKPGQIVVKEQIVTGEEIAILPADVEQLLVYSKTGSIPEEVRTVIQKAIEMKQKLFELQRQIDERQAAIAKIAEGQNRIRENIKIAQPNSAYSKRLLASLDNQETKIEQLLTEIEELTKQMESQRTELEGYLTNTNIG